MRLGAGVTSLGTRLGMTNDYMYTLRCFTNYLLGVFHVGLLKTCDPSQGAPHNVPKMR